jgi:hypothetical protein
MAPRLFKYGAQKLRGCRLNATPLGLMLTLLEQLGNRYTKTLPKGISDYLRTIPAILSKFWLYLQTISGSSRRLPSICCMESSLFGGCKIGSVQG